MSDKEKLEHIRWILSNQLHKAAFAVDEDEIYDCAWIWFQELSSGDCATILEILS